MKFEDIVNIFFKGLDDVLISLGIGGNSYQVQEVKKTELESIKTFLGDNATVVLWGKVEKNQGMLLLCLNSDDVRALVGAIEGTIPEEINENVMNTLKELNDTFLGGGLSSLAQSAKKGVIQFESTGIIKGNEIFEGSFSSQIQEPILYSSVVIEGSIKFSFPWFVLFDNLLMGWFSIEEEEEVSVSENTMLSQEEIESFLNSEVKQTVVENDNLKRVGEKPVSTQSTNAGYRNLDVILDIQVEATARLGSIEMPLATVLSLGPGSVINIGHEVDNPIELYVNNKLIAKGDVVIVDEKFGIRITEIVSPKERIESLQ